MIDEKEKIRKRILRALEEQSPQERRKRSTLIKEKLFRSKEYKAARVILFYLSMEGEVQTDEMIEAALKKKKRVAVPMTFVKERKLICAELDNLKGLVLGPYGIRLPRKIKEIPAKEIDLVIVPGVAYDKGLNRLGRGAGYYDRFLKKVAAGVPKIGLAFKLQVLKRLPSLSHDVPVTRLISA